MGRDCAPPARTAILWALAGFLALQLGLAISIEFWFPALGDPGYAFKADRLRRHFARFSPTHQATTHIVVLGSSRTLFGIDGAGLGQDLTAATGHPVAVFNFGVIGAGPITELLYLRKMLREGIVPDFLLIEVLPPFLAGQVEPPAEACWFLPCTRLRPCDRELLAHYHFPTSELRRTGWRSWVVPWHAHRRALLSRLGPSWLPFELSLNEIHATDAAGWVSECPPLPVGRPAQQANREHFTACFKDFRLQGPPADALCELLVTCRAARIPTALVLMPETSQFRGWYPTGMDHTIEKFLDRQAVPWIDARRWVPDVGFFDANHLHPGGAATLGRKLTRALLPLLKNRPPKFCDAS